MELSVLIQQTAGNGYRAWCGEPFPESAEGATREDAVEKLLALLEVRVRGVEVVRIRVPAVAASPVWPDDQITRDWLAGIAAARKATDHAPDPWDEPAAPGQP